jgi:predicted nuclease with TOPRIM domain
MSTSGGESFSALIEMEASLKERHLGAEGNLAAVQSQLQELQELNSKLKDELQESQEMSSNLKNQLQQLSKQHEESEEVWRKKEECTTNLEGKLSVVSIFMCRSN